jgi:CP family cyanate transporter-like MFS transporter
VTTSQPTTRFLLILLGIGIAVTAFNMRATVVAVGPLLDTIRDDTGMSTTVAGLLTTLPVVCFGALSGLAPRLARRFGIDLMIWLTMVGLTFGIAIRLAHPVPLLFLGTAVIGASLALANVLVPAVIKRDFPQRTGLMTGVYGVGLAAGSSLAAALMVPIDEGSDLEWRGTLGVLGIPALIAVIALIPRVRINRQRRATARERSLAVPSLWRNGLAWRVSIFMGMQSFIYFGLGSWMATFLVDNGISDARAGFLWSLCNLAGLPFSFVVPVLAQKFRDQRPLVVAMVTIWGVSIVGLLVSPADYAVLWMVLFGMGGGTALSLALMFIVLRSPDAAHASSLSGMAQAIGYTLAATAPFLFGALHDLTGDWQVSVAMIGLSLVPTLWAGWSAGQRRLVAPLPDAMQASAP